MRAFYLKEIIDKMGDRHEVNFLLQEEDVETYSQQILELEDRRAQAEALKQEKQQQCNDAETHFHEMEAQMKALTDSDLPLKVSLLLSCVLFQTRNVLVYLLQILELKQPFYLFQHPVAMFRLSVSCVAEFKRLNSIIDLPGKQDIFGNLVQILDIADEHIYVVLFCEILENLSVSTENFKKNTVSQNKSLSKVQN